MLQYVSMQAMQAKGLDENAPHTIGDAAQAYAAATLAGISCCSSDWDALDSAAFRSCTPEPGTPQINTLCCALQEAKMVHITLAGPKPQTNNVCRALLNAHTHDT